MTRLFFGLAALCLGGCAPSEARAQNGEAAPQAPQSDTNVTPADAAGFGSQPLEGVVLARSTRLDADELVRSARQLGVDVRPLRSDEETGHLAFEVGTGQTLYISPLRLSHPEACAKQLSPFSPSDDMLYSVLAHFHISLVGALGSTRKRDALISRLVAAVCCASDAIGAWTEPGTVIYRADTFVELVSGTPAGALPIEVCVDVTLAAAPGGRVQLLTVGMGRYNRDELLITSDDEGTGAVELMMGLMRQHLDESGQCLDAGATVTHGGAEPIVARRGLHPTGFGPDVVRLDMV